MYDQGMQNGSRRRGKSVLGSRVGKKIYSLAPNSWFSNVKGPPSLEINKGPQKKISERFLFYLFYFILFATLITKNIGKEEEKKKKEVARRPNRNYRSL